MIKNDPENYVTVGMAQADRAREVHAQLSLIKHLAEYTTEKNWADKRLYIMQAVDRALSPLPLVGQKEGGSTPAPVDHVQGLAIDAAWVALLEVDDRTSPPEYPDHALITKDELADFMRSAFDYGASIPPRSDVNAVEEGAKILAAWINYAWDGLGERDISDRYPDWCHNGAGHLGMQGGRPALRKVAANILALASPAPAELVRWLPIAQADRSITEVQDFSEVGITLRNSDPYWVRDDDGRVYEAVWTDDKAGYWWDLEGESPVDPVEFMPHPLDPRFAAPASEGSVDA